ncbi:MAG: hypothetical protein A2W19_06000 [Spirochaetes bacterium RBG_16_49_21]|nr:MAG: hypothetical protein A2W19_06000 [Spirochaetes bacterium RBG_16_49_21]
MKSILKKVLSMKLIFFITVAIVSLTVMAVYSAANFSSWKRAYLLKKSNYVKDEVLVQYKKNITYATRRASIQARGGTFLKEFGRPGLVHVRLSKGESIADALNKYENDPSVEYAQPNYIYHATLASTDPSYNQEWGLHNTGQTITNATYYPPSGPTHNPGTAGKDMNMENTWGVKHDCSTVIVAVVDSGVNYNHQDLAANMWNGVPASYPNHGYDYVDNDNDPMDLAGHGTHVAATIGAKGDNGLGTAGVCWEASIMAVRILNAAGMGTTAWAVSGINFAVTNGAKVINMSFGGSIDDPALSGAIDTARTNGVVVVTAAGNGDASGIGQNLNNTGNGYNDVYPCEFTQDNLLCVAALDQAYSRATFSNYGSTSVDVGAPGTNILSAYAGTDTVIDENFSTNWIMNGGWVRLIDYDFGYGPTDMLVIPPGWPSQAYGNNLDAKAYKEFNLSGNDEAHLMFLGFVDVEPSWDYINVNYNTSGGDPFSGGTQLLNYSGSSAVPIGAIYDITSCTTSSCSVGFQLTTDGTNIHTYYGVGIFYFNITAMALNNISYKVADGTSMAAPHVSGLAAILKAYNPDYTYADIIQSIKQGGDTESSLTTTTSTGKAVDSWGSLCYIQPPTGVAASVSQ